MRVPEAEYALLRARFFIVAARAAERRVELVLRERCFQRLGLHDVRVLGAVSEGRDAGLGRLLVDMDDQVESELARHAVAELDHVPELPGRVDVHQREWQLSGMESLARKVQENGAVLADRVQHDRVVELGRHLADDVDALRLEALELRHLSLCNRLRLPHARWTPSLVTQRGRIVPENPPRNSYLKAKA